jgi:hypothetical protein
MVDLQWKMNKFINSDDVSFLGHGIKQLNEQIALAESMEAVKKTDIILSINKAPCDTAKKLKITKNVYKPDKND